MHSREERLSAGRGNKGYGSRRIAPLVPDAWLPGQPVDVAARFPFGACAILIGIAAAFTAWHNRRRAAALR